jgi:hypothetical protein
MYTYFVNIFDIWMTELSLIPHSTVQNKNIEICNSSVIPFFLITTFIDLGNSDEDNLFAI